ncbi:MAG TPA: zf-HC2 domain-containing protein [Falsiroseomonas sp.]|jgi:hypothetical protein|nr:zf-HC2 domain-containing protein [Falsiroseomonas sp.]
MLTCKEVAARASRYLDDDLPALERTQLRMHLAMCKLCKRYMEQMSTTVRMLPAAAASEALDSTVEDQVMARLAAVRRPATTPALPAASAAPAAERPAPWALRVLGEALLTGLAGLAAWEIFARVAAPAWLGFALDPRTLIDAALGITGPGAVVVHLCTGLLLFPLAFLLVARPMARLLAPVLPWWGVAGVFGLVLWVFAGYVVANLMGGLPAFFGFGAVAWASLVGHGALALSMGAAAHLRRATA